MKILMSGITGLVGSAFVTELFRNRDDVEIIALVRGKGPAGAKERVDSVIKEQLNYDKEGGSAEKILKKITVVPHVAPNPFTEEQFALFSGVDTIFHCAADVNLGKDKKGLTYKCNFEGTKNMVETAKKLNVNKLHFVSTAYVAGKAQGIIKEDGLVPNNEFNNPYERSKYDAETLLRNSGIPFNIYRPSIIIGSLSDGRIRKPLAFYRLCDFMAKIKKLMSAKKFMSPKKEIYLPIRIESHMSKSVYFVPIDYVQRTITNLFLKGIKNKTYHITGEGPASVKDIQDVVCSILKIKGLKVVKEIKNPTSTERLMHKYIGDLLPYFSAEMKFDISNVKEELGENDLNWEVSYDTLYGILKEYFHTRFPELF
ncbi:MAG: SDR family oxidoreductase [Victivallales bacterium]|nr:SDR family oxidoreductase [Victivallales bacterium]MCF7889087.1 SDR family oxidoreductase [Victivallales bacterium]